MDVGEIEHVYVINLDSRPDRWQRFVASLPDEWPLPPPMRYRAVDGRICRPPSWWKQGPGAWGCYRSHLAILERAIVEGTACYMVLEDDALLCEAFPRRLTEFLAALPDDAQWIYLGGQLLHYECCPPQPANRLVYRPFNVHRTHSYILRGRTVMERLYQHLCEVPWAPRHHVDHRMGLLHEWDEVRVYVPARWLVAQRDGPSDVAGRMTDLRWWRHPEEVSGPAPPVVAVVGPYRSGTSCVAELLHRIGIPMGLDVRAMSRPMPYAPRGTWEAPRLQTLCRQAIQEPQLERRWSPETVRLALRRLIVERAHAQPGRPIGLKHPLLCLMIRELATVWPHVRIVAVDRDLQAAIRSGLETGWLPTAERVIPMMAETRDRDLAAAALPVYRLRYEQLIERPEHTVLSLATWLGLRLGRQELEAAVSVIDPTLCHHSTEATVCV